MAERDTWYVLEGGGVADPAECSCDDAGTLRHKSGVAVAMRGETHASRGVDPAAERAKSSRRDMAVDAAADASKADGRDMKPAAAKPYRTRGESKAD